jgi:hypothetical protein
MIYRLIRLASIYPSKEILKLGQVVLESMSEQELRRFAIKLFKTCDEANSEYELCANEIFEESLIPRFRKASKVLHAHATMLQKCMRLMKNKGLDVNPFWLDRIPKWIYKSDEMVKALT